MQCVCLRCSGGGSVTVIGTNLDVVNNPKMTTTIVVSNTTSGDPDKRPPIVTVRVKIYKSLGQIYYNYDGLNIINLKV